MTPVIVYYYNDLQSATVCDVIYIMSDTSGNLPLSIGASVCRSRISACIVGRQTGSSHERAEREVRFCYVTTNFGNVLVFSNTIGGNITLSNVLPLFFSLYYYMLFVLI